MTTETIAENENTFRRDFFNDLVNYNRINKELTENTKDFELARCKLHDYISRVLDSGYYMIMMSRNGNLYKVSDNEYSPGCSIEKMGEKCLQLESGDKGSEVLDEFDISGFKLACDCIDLLSSQEELFLARNNEQELFSKKWKNVRLENKELFIGDNGKLFRISTNQGSLVGFDIKEQTSASKLFGAICKEGNLK